MKKKTTAKKNTIKKKIIKKTPAKRTAKKSRTGFYSVTAKGPVVLNQAAVATLLKGGPDSENVHLFDPALTRDEAALHEHALGFGRAIEKLVQEKLVPARGSKWVMDDTMRVTWETKKGKLTKIALGFPGPTPEEVIQMLED